MDDDNRQVWQITVGLGVPEATVDAGDTEGIHPIALVLEESAHKIRGVNRIPCYTEFGPVVDVMSFAQRSLGDAYDPATAPVECSLAVYATDEELDELVHAVVEDLGVDKDGYSSSAGKKVTLGLRPISLEDPESSFYQHLVDQYTDQFQQRPE
ncbi:hypothetical protein [Nocardia rhamnosiphila]|uniref:Uncharacterized protein n=1 Tax=Nocardia rhamnosiphila TaxID=426716 RepID=A0ABV2WWF8_9NOCA